MNVIQLYSSVVIFSFFFFVVNFPSTQRTLTCINPTVVWVFLSRYVQTSRRVDVRIVCVKLELDAIVKDRLRYPGYQPS